MFYMWTIVMHLCSCRNRCGINSQMMMMMMTMIVRLTVSENALKKKYIKRAVCGQRAVRVTTAAAAAR